MLAIVIDEFDDFGEFFAGDVGKWESVGGFVADGRKTERAEFENALRNGVLAERGVLDGDEVDNVDGARNWRGHHHLHDTLVGDKKFVATKNNSGDKSDEKNRRNKSKQEEVQEIVAHGI